VYLILASANGLGLVSELESNYKVISNIAVLSVTTIKVYNRVTELSSLVCLVKLPS